MIITSCNDKKTIFIDYPIQIKLSKKMKLRDIDKDLEYHIYNGYYFKRSQEFDFIALQTFYRSTEAKPDLSQKLYCIQIGLKSNEENYNMQLEKKYKILSKKRNNDEIINIYMKDFVRFVYYRYKNNARILIFPNPLSPDEIENSIKNRISLLYNLKLNYK